MTKYDILTGNEIKEGEENASPIKSMCLNCVSCLNEDDNYRCNHPKVMETGLKKVAASLPEGFEIETLVLKPMVLKNPTKKCPNYEFNAENVLSTIKKSMGIE